MIQKRQMWLFLLLVVIGLSAALLVACGGQQAAPAEQSKPAQQSAPAEQPAPTEQEAVQAEQNPEAAAIDGKSLLEERCTACHSLEKAQSGQRDQAGWQAIVDKMVKKGAKLNQDEAKVVAEYLANLK